MKTYILFAFIVLACACATIPMTDVEGNITGVQTMLPLWSSGTDGSEGAPWYVEWALEAGLGLLGLGGVASSKKARGMIGATARTLSSPLRRSKPAAK